MNKTLLPVAALFLVSTFSSLACSCAPPPAPKVALKNASAVFSGEVRKITTSKKDYIHTVEFKVLKSWKGVKGKTVKVTTALDGAACGYGFTKGEKYLVYANGGQPFRTSICTRTKSLNRAAADIKELGETP